MTDNEIKQLDIRGKVCPDTLNEIQKLMDEVSAGTKIVILTDNRRTVHAVPMVYPTNRYPLEIKEIDKYWEIQITKPQSSGGEELKAKIQVENVSHTHQNQKQKIVVLDNINLKIEENQFVCLVGPSGCGKSTLLNMMAGLDSPDSGQIYYNGQKITGPTIDRIMIFQESALFPWLTVRQNVEFGLKMKKINKNERKELVDKYLKMVHLSKFNDSYIHQLSGGMKQRAALARALVMDTDVLLMDEPFGALDAQTKDVLQGELQDIFSKTKKTIVFVTHDVREAVILGDRVVLMSHRPGKVIREFFITEPRPRSMDNEGMMDIAGAILNELKKEVDIVVQEELGFEKVH